jgi:hypothetical protein
MKTLFEITPFNRPAFAPRLGAWEWLTDLWSEVKDIAPIARDAWKGYTSAEKAEEERKAAEARAAAAAAQARTAATQTAPSSGIMGIPTGYLVVGGLGLVAIGILVVMMKK